MTAPRRWFARVAKTRLQLEKRPQTVQEGGFVFAFFSLVLAVGNRLFQNSFSFHFPVGEQFAEPFQAIGRSAKHLCHYWLADLHDLAIGFGAHCRRSA